MRVLLYLKQKINFQLSQLKRKAEKTLKRHGNQKGHHYFWVVWGSESLIVAVSLIFAHEKSDSKSYTRTLSEEKHMK